MCIYNKQLTYVELEPKNLAHFLVPYMAMVSDLELGQAVWLSSNVPDSLHNFEQ